jgi:DNA polymerase III delta prime subunit
MERSQLRLEKSNELVMKNIMLSGPDGTGKSTIADAVITELKHKNIVLNHVWLRFNHYLAKIINLLGRITGKSYYETYSWGKSGYHEYEGVLGFFYVLAVYLDHLFFDLILRNNYLKFQQNYLIDRFIIDIIADLIVDTKRPNMIFFLFAPFLKKELKLAHAFILKCDKEIVISRRIDILDDKSYDAKISAYKLIASRFDITTVDSGKLTIEQSVSEITNAINQKL